MDPSGPVTVTDSGRRVGDAAVIDGGYQHRALLAGPPTQRFWHRSKLNLLDWMFPITAGDRVLDVGCGSGVFSDAMARRGAMVLGVDANGLAMDYAQKTFGGPGGPTFRQGLLDELPIEPGSFDKAVCLEVIEHVYPQQVSKLFADLFGILRAGGKMLVTTPNYRGTWPIIEWAADRFSPVAKMDADQHVTHFNRQSLRAALVASGFEVLEIRTYSTVAPFVAPISWAIAQRIERMERKVDLPFGNVLAAVARRPD